MYRQALAAVEAALAALPERVRSAFVAHRLHGQSQALIARQLGVSLNTVERDLTAATDRIEAALHHWRGERPGAAAPRSGRRKGLASLLSLAGLSLGASLLWQHWRAQALHWQEAFAVPRGGRRTETLPDGSEVVLDAGTRIEFAFDAGRRVARLLAGAAFFGVQRDPGRPFLVEAGGVTATVLGTRFGVDREPGGAVLVQVESGRVRVEHAAAAAVELTAGQGLRIGADGRGQPAAGAAASWRDGIRHFDAVPLGEVVQRLARYARFELQAEPRAARLRVSGTVEVAHLGEWLQSLHAVLPVRVARQGDGVVWIAAH
ncbi:MAG: Protein FecR [Xylophilus sp.]|nr:MAG: Protein FecR [Xylophilus sp.]